MQVGRKMTELEAFEVLSVILYIYINMHIHT